MPHISLKKIHKPREKNVENDIKWLCDSFNLSSGRDVDFVASKIMESIIKMFAEDGRISTESVADGLKISQGIVNHHLRNLIDTGIVERHRRIIVLRGGSLKGAVQEMRKDANRIFDEIESVAEEVDDALGLKNR